MKFWKILSLAIALVVTTKVNATIIFDTGLISCDSFVCGGSTFSSILNPNDKLAARFTLNSNTTITDLTAWVNTVGNFYTTFTMALYGGDNAISPDLTPDVTNELFSQDVLVTDNIFEDNDSNQWQGLSNLNIILGPGSYWLSLELRNGNNYDGYIPTNEYGALNALDAYAFFNPLNSVWLENPAVDFAYQISGNVSAVPLPATIWFFGSGLLGLLGIARRKSRN